jgi:hypothetical protein
LADIKTLIEASTKEVLEKFEKVISKQTEKIASLTKRIEELGNSNAFLEKKCNYLEEQVGKMSGAMFEELEDRSRRRKNLIFSGIPEQKEGSAEERKEADMNFVQKILNDLSVPREGRSLKVHRIGKPITGKNRILKVIFGDEEDRQNVLRKAKFLRNIPMHRRIFINPDLTIFQQNERKRLTEELKRRRSAGEDVHGYFPERGCSKVAGFKFSVRVLSGSSAALPSILYANVRSVFPKMDEIRCTLKFRSVDVFACSESWLTDNHSDDMVGVVGYRVFREDRSQRTGGGVAAWIRDSIQACRLPCQHPAQLECISLHLVTFNIVLLVIYVPPDIATKEAKLVNDFVVDHVDSILNKVPGMDIIICGDLNRLNVSNIKISLNMFDLHKKPTYGEAQLDYILMSDSLTAHYTVMDTAPIDVSKTPHLSLLAIPANKFKTLPEINRTVFDLRSSNIDHFVDEASRVNWSFLDETSISLDKKCEEFHFILDNIFDRSIPKSKIKSTKCDKPWITGVIKDMINKRWNAYRQKKFQMYNHLKLKVRLEIERSKRSWINRMKNTDLWKTVHSVTGSKATNPIMTLISQFNSVEDAAENINQCLSSVFLPRCQLSVPATEDNESWAIDISPEMIFDMLQKLPLNKATSDVPSILYKKAATVLANPLCKLFRLSISQCIVPEIWKLSSICPIPKTKTPTPEEIRPISLLRLPIKLLEKVLLKSMKSKFVDNFGEQQFGYRPNSSTACALISLHEYVTRYLDDKDTNGVMIVSYDYSKAFDRLRTDLILQALQNHKFPHGFRAWVQSYLTGRWQQVVIGDAHSSKTPVTSGVPQGSVLGPFLFSLTIATFNIHPEAGHLVKYADDTTICFPIYNKMSNSHISFQHERLLKWSSDMDLKVNGKKCKSLIIKKSPNCEEVQLQGVTSVSSMSLLGITFNAQGAWSSHVRNITRTASRRLYALRLLRSSLSHRELVLVYNALVRSIMEYCAPLFLGLTAEDSQRLKTVQNRFHKLMCGKDCRENCLEDLDFRRRQLSLRLLNKIRSHAHILNTILPKATPSGRFILPYRRTTRRSKSYIPMICEIANMLHKR